MNSGVLNIDNYKLIEFVDENSFKELSKKKLYHFNKNANTEEYDSMDIKDKCIICDQMLNSEVSKDDFAIEIEVDEIDKDDNNINSKEDSKMVKEDEVNNVNELAKCPYCQCFYHIICLAQANLPDTMSLIPGKTLCNVCNQTADWGEFIINEDN
jgi:hypothetical protein